MYKLCAPYLHAYINKFAAFSESHEKFLVIKPIFHSFTKNFFNNPWYFSSDNELCKLFIYRGILCNFKNLLFKWNLLHKHNEIARF